MPLFNFHITSKRQVILLLISAVWFIGHLKAQTVYNDGVDIYITAGTDVYLDQMSFQNQTNGTDGSIDNDGNIHLDENWTNNVAGNNVFVGTNGTGTTLFVGNTNQTIGGSNTTSFENFTANNSIVAGTAITLSTNATALNTVTLTDGVIATGGNTFIMSSTVAADLAAFSNASFVNGNLQRGIATNTSTYTFPVGIGTTTTDYYRYDVINNNLTGTTALTVRADAIAEVGGDVDANLTATEDGTPFNNVIENAGWTMTPNIALGGGSFGVRAYTANLPGITDNRFAILNRTNASINYADWNSLDATTTIPTAGMAGRTVASGYAEKLGFTVFEKFAVADAIFPLPINLLSFDATAEDNMVRLDWVTLGEQNNQYFFVERSKNGVDFEHVLRVDGAGTHPSMLSYLEYDYKPYMGVSYYRLKQRDFNGDSTYSDIRSVYFSGSDQAFSIYPNPSNGRNITIQIYSDYIDERTAVEVFNNLGQKVYSLNLNSSNEGISEYNSVTIDKDLAFGTYTVRLISGNEYFIEKLIVR